MMANVGLYFIYFLFLSNFWGAVQCAYVGWHRNMRCYAVGVAFQSATYGHCLIFSYKATSSM